MRSGAWFSRSLFVVEYATYDPRYYRISDPRITNNDGPSHESPAQGLALHQRQLCRGRAGPRTAGDLSGDRRDHRDAACRDPEHRRACHRGRARRAARVGAAEAGRARTHPAPRRRPPARAQRRTGAAGDAGHRQGDPGNAGSRRSLRRRRAGVFRRRGCRPSAASISISAAPSPIRAARRWASASASARGTIRSRSPAGNPRRRSPWATPWCSSHRKTRR